MSGRETAIHTITLNERRTSAHVHLQYGSDRLFAKVLLRDRYPKLTPEFILAGDERLGECWDADAQLRAERDRSDEFRQVASAVEGVSVPKVVEYSERDRVIVWQHVRGVSLDDLIKRPLARNRLVRRPQAVAFLAGKFMRHLHSHFQSDQRRLQIIDCQPLVERAERVMPQWMPILAEAMSELKSSIQAEKTGEMPVTTIHGDLSLSNLLWDEDGHTLHIVDLEHSRTDSAVFDLAAWIYGLRVSLFRPLVTQSVVAQWECGFYDGYDAGDTTRNAAYRAAELVAVVWIFGYFLPQRLLEREARAQGLEWVRRVAYRQFVMRPLLVHRAEAIKRALRTCNQ